MTLNANCIDTEKVACIHSLGAALEHLERLKTMTHIMEAQLLNRAPGLAELASNMSDEIDGVVDRITASGT
ncbi:hypothetical protein ACFL2H_11560 [Planctomycetota bacterium]